MPARGARSAPILNIFLDLGFWIISQHNGIMQTATDTTHSLIDNFARKVTYLRLSVTDRCDFRCLYCMGETMSFVPRPQILSLEELATIAEAFTELGVTKIRVTGGEPLIRRDLLTLLRRLRNLPGLAELCLTTNGSRLTEYAKPLVEAGVTRINISLDSLRADRFQTLTRHGHLPTVLAGIRAAQEAGFERIKLNSVLMRHYNADEFLDLVRFALDSGLDISFIEEMPLGRVTSHSRAGEFVSSHFLRERLQHHFALQPLSVSSGGPSRYWRAEGFSSRIGFISPHSDNFCSSCNRVRVTAEGRLLLCLGNEHSLDLRTLVRDHPGDKQRLRAAIMQSMVIKPERHDFNLDGAPQILRFMNATGG